MFKIIKKSRKTNSRLGVLTTSSGRVDTPFFMPIATKAAIKSLTVAEVKDLGAQIILSNTYHNYLRPGITTIKKFGGLHQFMNCDLPILTDSGGYQVFSLSNLRKIKGNNIEFRSHIDGSLQILNPKKVIDIQRALGSDIMMVLDECVGLPTTKAKAEQALERTHHWAKMSIDYKKKLGAKSAKIRKQLLFGIVQGADFKDLRLQSAQYLSSLGFDGLAVGGLAVGEPNKTMYEVLKYTVPALPEDKPRYLMGVGYPENIIEAVKYGIDMFDCVIPTREARHGKLYLWRNPLRLSGTSPLTLLRYAPQGAARGGGGLFYRTINITNAKFAKDKSPINKDHPLLKQYSKAYLHHLFKTQEPLALRLATLNNLKFYLDLMKEIRKAIKAGEL